MHWPIRDMVAGSRSLRTAFFSDPEDNIFQILKKKYSV
ncbi:hypothetical protein EBBID32_27720 [Sphingobium indicum BiD32]|uniref:Uncharacterized protein n=1 Tax=Sphingobium indicum BiD32 TaxID=1301087 RepID=N1MNV6_9SPHN|nr:hypothetical protein EBBID32_27720 [Sphingobium indicum BiD32]